VAEAVSPLRYPGGKQILARVLGHLIRMNGREGGIYVEPYAGGAGAAFSLLFGEYVKQIFINDADSRIFAFWDSVVHQTGKFLKLLFETSLSVEEWKRQREIYSKPGRHSRVRVGFAAFYLNRCNRSGIIVNAGLIGGKSQTGKWKMDARFNRTDLAARIEKIARYKERISIFNLDATEFLRTKLPNPSVVDRAFVYLDPPYYAKSNQLYLNHYTPEDHSAFAKYLLRARFKWVMSYDNVPEIQKLYSTYRRVPFNLGYSARECKLGKEILILPPHIHFPRAWLRGIPDQFISAATIIAGRIPLPTR
jgi:DNA adenine methylase